MTQTFQKIPQPFLDLIKNNSINRFKSKTPSIRSMTSLKALQKCKVRHSQVNTGSCDEENICKTLQNNRKTAIKLKLLRSKKRTLNNVQLGIGFQSNTNQIPKTKVYQQFFPQRTLTMFKKLAFKNWNAKQQSEKVSYQKLKFSPKKSDPQIRCYRQKTLPETKNSALTQLKIISIGQSFHFKINQSLSNKNFDKKLSKKKSFDKTTCFSQIQTKDQCNSQWEAIGPWPFQEFDI